MRAIPPHACTGGKKHITGSIERHCKVFIHAVHARLTTTHLQMSCLGSRAVVRTMAPSPFDRFALWLVRLLPDLLMCLTGSPQARLPPNDKIKLIIYRVWQKMFPKVVRHFLGNRL